MVTLICFVYEECAIVVLMHDYPWSVLYALAAAPACGVTSVGHPVPPLETSKDFKENSILKNLICFGWCIVVSKAQPARARNG